MIKNKNNLVLTQTLKDKLWEKNISDEVLRTFIKRVRLKTSKELREAHNLGKMYKAGSFND